MVETAYMGPTSTGRLAAMREATNVLTSEPLMQAADAQLDRARRNAGRVEREYAIHGLLTGIRREAARHRKRTGSLVDAWEQVVPAALAAGTRVHSITGGVAKIGVASPALSFELDRALRSGLLAELRTLYGGTLRRVRLEQDSSLGS
jgi:hypothetical protein